jgi:hypothetical protein
VPARGPDCRHRGGPLAHSRHGSHRLSRRGKTTLANRILSEDHGLRIAVLINDFGDVDIDNELIVGITSNQISLAN